MLKWRSGVNKQLVIRVTRNIIYLQLKVILVRASEMNYVRDTKITLDSYPFGALHLTERSYGNFFFGYKRVAFVNWQSLLGLAVIDFHICSAFLYISPPMTLWKHCTYILHYFQVTRMFLTNTYSILVQISTLTAAESDPIKSILSVDIDVKLL